MKSTKKHSDDQHHVPGTGGRSHHKRLVHKARHHKDQDKPGDLHEPHRKSRADHT